jgi:hypothetical protein
MVHVLTVFALVWLLILTIGVATDSFDMVVGCITVLVTIISVSVLLYRLGEFVIFLL